MLTVTETTEKLGVSVQTVSQRSIRSNLTTVLNPKANPRQRRRLLLRSEVETTGSVVSTGRSSLQVGHLYGAIASIPIPPHLHPSITPHKPPPVRSKQFIAPNTRSSTHYKPLPVRSKRFIAPSTRSSTHYKPLLVRSRRFIAENTPQNTPYKPLPVRSKRFIAPNTPSSTPYKPLPARNKRFIAPKHAPKHALQTPPRS